MLPHLTSTDEQVHSFTKVLLLGKLVSFQKEHERVPSLNLYMVFPSLFDPCVDVRHLLQSHAHLINGRSTLFVGFASLVLHKNTKGQGNLEALSQENTVSKGIFVHGPTHSRVKVLELYQTRRGQLASGSEKQRKGGSSKIHAGCPDEPVLTQAFERHRSSGSYSGRRRLPCLHEDLTTGDQRCLHQTIRLPLVQVHRPPITALLVKTLLLPQAQRLFDHLDLEIRFNKHLPDETLLRDESEKLPDVDFN